jgi:DNA-binding NarL/FixJ family response regulator
MKPIRTIIVDDEPGAVNRLMRLLKMFSEMELVASCTFAAKSVDLILQQRPEVVFLDVEMPVMSGFEVIHKVEESHFHPLYIIITAYNHYTKTAIKKQVFDYLEKPVDFDELKETLERLRLAIQKPSDWIENLNFSPQVMASLTTREAEMLPYMLKGLTSRDIADQLYLSKHTIDTYRRQILHKLEASNTAELIYKLSVVE